MNILIKDFLRTYPFPETAVREVLEAYERVTAEEDTRRDLLSMTDAYREGGAVDFDRAVERMQDISRRADIHPYTGYLVLVCAFAALARAHYEREGLSEELYRATMNDVYYKYEECRLVYGVTGIFVPAWFGRFFRLERFAFGLLQFECTACKAVCTLNGVPMHIGDPTVNIHVPRSGKRLTPAEVDRSLALGCAFLEKRYGLSAPIVIEINSWLLYPENRAMLSEGSNIRAFMDRFYIAKAGEYEDYSQVWRLFDQNYEGDPDALPADTSLRRAYIARIREGKPLGWGYGLLVYKRA